MMNGRAEASSVLLESSVTVFVNFAAGGGRASARLPEIRKVFESRRVSAQFVLTANAETSMPRWAHGKTWYIAIMPASMCSSMWQ